MSSPENKKRLYVVEKIQWILEFLQRENVDCTGHKIQQKKEPYLGTNVTCKVMPIHMLAA